MKCLWIIPAAILGVVSAAGAAELPSPQTTESPQQLQQQLEQAQQALQTAAARVAALSLRTFDHQFHQGLWQVNMSMGWARLGINLGDEQHGGLAVEAVTPGGAADKAGIRAGDTLESVGGVQLDKAHRHQLDAVLDDLDPGEQIAVTWNRGGKTHKATLTAQDMFASVRRWAKLEGKFAARKGAAAARMVMANFDHPMPPAHFGFFQFFPGRWGDMELATLTPALGKYFGTNAGLLVVRAPHDDALKLRDGDVILKIGSRAPGSPTQAMRILRSYMPGDTLEMTVMRDRERHKLKVTLKQQDQFKATPIHG